jgi:hypothetical protein
LSGSRAVLTSQPFDATRSQSIYPGLQDKIPQLAPLQEGVACGKVHTWPQPPQLFGSLPVSTSHPVAAILSQSAKPDVQDEVAQLDPVHEDVAWAKMHTLPQPPQLLWSLVEFTHSVPASPGPGQTLGSAVGHTHPPP